MHRADVTDAQWARLQPVLPPQRHGKGTKGGRPSIDHRPLINGSRWILRTGAAWDDLPTRYGKRSTVSTRSYRWKEQGGWDRIYDAVKAQAAAAGDLDWESHHGDATVRRAHQHAAGANKGTQRPKRWAAAKAASGPKAISAPMGMANRTPAC